MTCNLSDTFHSSAALADLNSVLAKSSGIIELSGHRSQATRIYHPNGIAPCLQCGTAPFVLDTARSMPMPNAFTKDISQNTKIGEISLKSMHQRYLTLISCVEVFLAKLSPLQENMADLMTTEASSSLISLGLLKRNNHALYCLKTSKAFCLTTKETLHLQSSQSLMNWGMTANGKCLTVKNLGVPQNRERVFIVGHLRGTSRPKVFPLTATTKKEVSNYYPKLSNCFAAPRIRKLTPIECERLQGFPDEWTKGLSNTQRQICLANSVTTYVIRDIIKAMLAC